MTITREQLKAACRAHDNASDTGSSFPDIMGRRGVEPKDVTYVAEQRALRMVLSLRGEMPDATKFTAIRLTQSEQDLLMKLASMWIDGLAVGLKCTEE